VPAAADPDLAMRLAKETADLYGQAVEDLLRVVATRLARGVDQPGWAEAKLAEMVHLRNEATVVVEQLTAGGPEAIAAAIRAAHRAGFEQGAAEPGASGIETTFTGANTRAVAALVEETVTAVNATHGQILRSVQDIYRQVVSQTVTGVVTGTTTTRQAAQAALDRLRDPGGDRVPGRGGPELAVGFVRGDGDPHRVGAGADRRHARTVRRRRTGPGDRVGRPAGMPAVSAVGGPGPVDLGR